MHLRATARPSICQSATKALLGALLVPRSRSARRPRSRTPARCWSSPARPGRANPASADIADAIKALGTANDFTVDVTGAASSINGGNLAGYRAVVFVHSAGDVLDTAQEAALQAYVEAGGGYVGIGESALLEQGGAAFFNTLTGLAGRPHHRHRHLEQRRTSSSSTACTRRRASCRCVQKAMTETWYTWATNPTGTVHTVARVRGNTLPDGTSITNDARHEPLHRRHHGQPAAAQPARGLVP